MAGKLKCNSMPIGLHDGPICLDEQFAHHYAPAAFFYDKAGYAFPCTTVQWDNIVISAFFLTYWKWATE